MELYTIAELMGKLKVSRQTIYNWFERGLKKTVIGGTVRITENDLQAFMKKE